MNWKEPCPYYTTKLYFVLAENVLNKMIVKGCTPIAFTEKLEIIIKIKNIIIPDKCPNNLRKSLPSLYYKQ